MKNREIFREFAEFLKLNNLADERTECGDVSIDMISYDGLIKALVKFAYNNDENLVTEELRALDRIYQYNLWQSWEKRENEPAI